MQPRARRRVPVARFVTTSALSFGVSQRSRSVRRVWKAMRTRPRPSNSSADSARSHLAAGTRCYVVEQSGNHWTASSETLGQEQFSSQADAVLHAVAYA